jgi:hypothetical protein
MVVSGAQALDNPAMNEAWLQENWALAGAGLAVGVAAIAVIAHLLLQSRRGRLAALARDVGRERRAMVTAGRGYAKAKRRAEGLQKKVERIPPRKLDEARRALADAERLVEIRGGALQVAEHRLRTLIAEEYPPNRHAALRRRYGVTEHAETRPFTFDGS